LQAGPITSPTPRRSVFPVRATLDFAMESLVDPQFPMICTVGSPVTH
jgi:hypothetical protein